MTELPRKSVKELQSKLNLNFGPPAGADVQPKVLQPNILFQ